MGRKNRPDPMATKEPIHYLARFHFLGQVKNIIYSGKIHDIEHLWEKVIAIVGRITRNMLRKSGFPSGRMHGKIVLDVFGARIAVN